MFTKSKISILFSIITTSFCLVLYSNTSFADVISATISPDILEPVNTYTQTGPTILDMSVDTVIGSGSCISGSYAGCVLDDVLNDINSSDDFKPEIKVHMTASDFPNDGLTSNATLRQRGATSRNAPQKSFRIKLKSKKKLWRGERKMQLVKSSYDISRIRNKLSYDLFSEIPHIPSMRTQFIDFKINDQGTNEAYGLYTHVENFGKEYLVRRGWDKDSRVYKIERSLLKNKSALAIDPITGKPVNLEAFEKLIEIKRGDTHLDFASMIKDLSDNTIDFNTQIMGKYFNLDNYLTWFAVNILLNNQDTVTHNFYLYNPKGNSHFYFVPWDYDASLGIEHDDARKPLSQLPRWWFSQNNWSDNKLHRRFLSEPGNLELLKAAVLEVKNKYLTEATIQQKIDGYRNFVFPALNQSPDWNYLWLDDEVDYDRILSNITNSIEFNYTKFLERVNDPMTFYMDDPVFLDNHVIFFDWSKSDSATNQVIEYELEVSTTKEFKAGTIIRSVKNITDTQHRLTWTHPKGVYFFRVRARDTANPEQFWQESTNEGLIFDDGERLFSILQMFVPTDGGTTPPPGTSVSNPVTSIDVDGSNSEWTGLTLFGDDPDDIASGSTNIIDWQNAGIAHNSQNVYFMYNNRGPIDPLNNTGQYVAWGYQVMIDSDKNPSTGFQYTDAVGVDYLITGNTIYQYTGTGTDWNWKVITDASSQFSGNIFELGFSRSLIGNSASIRVVFDGRNAAFGGSTTDVYPDGALNTSSTQRYFEYSFGTIVPTNHTPITQNKNISVIENNKAIISLDASDADNDTLALTIVDQPTHGNLVFSATSLTVEYQPDQNYTGADSFKFKVNDGTEDSNISIVDITVNTAPSTSVISNHVVIGGIILDGNKSDWNNLELFSDDPDDVTAGATNIINWLSAGIAHSSDTVYLLYDNRGGIDPNATSTTVLTWGWQAFLDTDSDSTTGFKFSQNLGMDYMLEGHELYKYTGDGSSWDWVLVATMNIKFDGNIAEISFPRSLLGSVNSTIKIVFYGNNAAFGGNTSDRYPDTGSLEYHFGSGSAGRPVPMSSEQNGIMKSPDNHKIKINTTVKPTVKNSAKGGSISWYWLIMFVSTLFIRRRLLS